MIAFIVGLFLCYVIPANALSNKSSKIVNQNSIIEEQQEISLEQVVYMPKNMQKAPTLNINHLTEQQMIKQSDTPKEIYIKGYTTTRVNIRQEASITSQILKTLDFNTPILYTKIEQNDKWLQVKYEDTIAYIAQEYVSNTKCKYKEYQIPDNDGFKSYMSYTAITSTTSDQYKIQNEYAYTGSYGIRQVQGRFCIALGSYFDVEIGQYIDLILKNGMVIPCILGDAKADIHTDKNNLFTIANGCCSEFIIDSSKLNSDAERDGNMSSCREEWNSPVVSVRVYEKNILK